MSKFGNKGFMMAEVVVVSVIVATSLVVLYTSTNRLTTAFNLRNRYHDLDALNLAIAVNDKLIKDGTINTIIKDYSAININDNVSNIKNLYDSYNDGNGVNTYFIKNNNGIDISSLTGVRNTTKDYFDYLKKNISVDDNYYIVSEICITEDNCFYYGLGVK